MVATTERRTPQRANHMEHFRRYFSAGVLEAEKIGALMRNGRRSSRSSGSRLSSSCARSRRRYRA